MARHFIAEYQPGEQVDDEVFLIKSKDLRRTTQGSLYIHAVLIDRTGEMVARAWQASESMFTALPEGGFIRLKGRVESYKGNLQFIIEAIRTVEEAEIDVGDFLPRTKKDIDAMWARTREILGEVEHPVLAELVGEFLADDELMSRFRKAPAAMTMHHAYVGGLLEHTLNVLELAVRVIPLYPELSLDLVLVGVWLHDIGKAAELACDRAIEYTDEGQLLGHITLAVSWIERKTDAVAKRTGAPFPERIKWCLEHIVLSHHGQYEFGSPKLPAIPEAIAVHHLDNLDAKISMYLGEITGDPNPTGHWTNYNRALATKIYKPDVMGVRSGA
jgi:3'-5' exoribonuclease